MWWPLHTAPPIGQAQRLTRRPPYTARSSSAARTATRPGVTGATGRASRGPRSQSAHAMAAGSVQSRELLSGDVRASIRRHWTDPSLDGVDRNTAVVSRAWKMSTKRSSHCRSVGSRTARSRTARYRFHAASREPGGGGRSHRRLQPHVGLPSRQSAAPGRPASRGRARGPSGGRRGGDLAEEQARGGPGAPHHTGARPSPQRHHDQRDHEDGGEVHEAR